MRIYMSIVWIALALQSSNVFAERLLMKNATLMTMSAEGTLEGADLLLEDGEIRAMGIDLQATADTVIDVAGATVTPTLFAGATAIGLVEVNAVKESVDSSLSNSPIGKVHIEFDVRDAYSPHSSLVGITRVEGYGYSLLMANGAEYSVSGIGSLVELDGRFDSFSGNDTLFIDVDGYSSGKVGGSRAAHWMLLEGMMSDLDRRPDSQEYLTQAGRKQLKELRSEGVFVFAANRAADIKQVINFTEKHRLSSVVIGAREAWMLASQLADSGIAVMVNGLDNLPADFDSLGSRLDNAAILNDTGVTVMFTSGGTHNARKVRQGAGTAVAYGMNYMSALRAMTVVPSQIFGGRDRAIKVGNSTDLVVWSGDPLEITSHATAVIMAGQVTSMETRQSKLLERYLPEKPSLGRAYINR